jgi:hypothetical protein
LEEKNIMKNAIILFIILILGISPFCGCITKGTGTLIIMITDDPPKLNISKALVTITSVGVHKAGVGYDGNDESSEGWITIEDEAQTFDLILLQNLTDLLSQVEIGVGIYTQIRLYIEKILVTIDDVEYDLKIPSNVVRIVSNFLIFDEETTDLLLDFDIHKSVCKEGYDEYIFNPTIKVTQS